MARKRALKQPNLPPHPSKKIMDVAPPASFPKIGSTLSSYGQAARGERGIPPQRGTIVAIDRKARRRHRAKKIFKWSVITLLIVILIGGGWVGYKFVRNETKLFGGNIFGLLHSTKLKGEDQGRVNILLAGNSADDPGHNGANLTDSIMLISLDTKDNKAFMLSIPRDLWVEIPGNGHQKINAAYEDGGMNLLDKVVSQDFGIPIDYYALINYAAFRDAVNAVDGISVNIQSCSPYGLYDPDIDYTTDHVLVDLSNGQHTLNGEQALDLARARGDAYGSYGFCQSDFTRQQDQRLMLLALKQKALTLGVLSNPIKLGNLFDSIGNNVKTNLTASDARELYNLTKKISNNNITSASLSYGTSNALLTSFTSYSSGDALMPTAGRDDFSAVQAYVQQLIASEAPKQTSSQ